MKPFPKYMIDDSESVFWFASPGTGIRISGPGILHAWHNKTEADEIEELMSEFKDYEVKE